ncbi:MAG: single-stranded DNA-binding protein [Leucobacter sp.]
MSTPICVVGTIATDPKFHRSNANVAFCSFRLASNERRYDREQGKWIDGSTSWFTINAFRSLAEHASESFKKGDRIVVSGRARTREWSNESRSGTVLEVESDALGHDLRWGVSTFSKRFGGGAAEEEGSGAGLELDASTQQDGAGDARDQASPDDGSGPSSGAQSAWTAPTEAAKAASASGEDDGFLSRAA